MMSPHQFPLPPLFSLGDERYLMQRLLLIEA